MKQAVFLDRDGTLHEDVHFLRDPEDLRLFESAGPALRLLRERGFLLVVVTNQSGIARGYLDEDRLAAIHARLREQLAALGVTIDAIYHCPHHPEDAREERHRVDCACRKPRPGMFLQAARELAIDLERSYAIGDAARDVEAARAAGVTALFVRSGRCKEPLWSPGEEPAASCEDLLEAARWIVQEEERRNAHTTGK